MNVFEQSGETQNRQIQRAYWRNPSGQKMKLVNNSGACIFSEEGLRAKLKNKF
jgi:hypothetical protein